VNRADKKRRAGTKSGWTRGYTLFGHRGWLWVEHGETTHWASGRERPDWTPDSMDAELRAQDKAEVSRALLHTAMFAVVGIPSIFLLGLWWWLA
jgi:hypothetical protein